MGYVPPKIYTLTIGSVYHDPADSSVYYIGGDYGVAPTATEPAMKRVYIPKAGKIRVGQITTYAENATGTAEDIVMAIRLNNATDYTFATVGAATPNRLFENYDLNIDVVQGDYITIKITTPAWVTNPLRLHYSGTILIEA